MAFLSLFASCGVLFVIFFLVATLLRAATALANRMIGPIKTEAAIIWGDWDSDDDDDEILPKGNDAAIPEPGLGRGMLIAFLTMLASLFGGGLARAILDSDLLGILDDEVVKIGTLVFGTLAGYLAMLALLAGMLPTKPKWAALAALFMFLILLGLTVFVVGVVYLVLG